MSEVCQVKRTLVYVASAVALGVAFTLVPLVAFAQIRFYGQPPLEAIGRSMREIENSGSYPTSRVTADEVETLGASFAIAAIAYALFKRKTSTRRIRQIRPYPY